MANDKDVVIADRLMDAMWPDIEWRVAPGFLTDRNAIASALSAVRAAENEACAKVAEAHEEARVALLHNYSMADRVAASIRARQTPTGGDQHD